MNFSVVRIYNVFNSPLILSYPTYNENNVVVMVLILYIVTHKKINHENLNNLCNDSVISTSSSILLSQDEMLYCIDVMICIVWLCRMLPIAFPSIMYAK
jgi:hypothetical protein